MAIAYEEGMKRDFSLAEKWIRGKSFDLAGGECSGSRESPVGSLQFQPRDFPDPPSPPLKIPPMRALARILEENANLLESLFEIDGVPHKVDLVEWIYECETNSRPSPESYVCIIGDHSLRCSIRALASGKGVFLLSEFKLSSLFLKECVEGAGFSPEVFQVFAVESEMEAPFLAPKYLPLFWESDACVHPPSTELKWRFALSGTSFPDSAFRGGSPALIFDSADLDSAVEWIASSFRRFRSRSIFRASRLHVQESIYEIFIIKLKKRLEKLRIGPDLGADAIMTEKDDIWMRSLFPDKLHDKVVPLVLDPSYPARPSDSLVLFAAPFRTAKEAISLANLITDKEAFIFSEDLSLAFEVSLGLDFDSIMVNGAGGPGCLLNKYLKTGISTVKGTALEKLEAEVKKIQPISIDKVLVLASKAKNNWASFSFRRRSLLDSIDGCNVDKDLVKKWLDKASLMNGNCHKNGVHSLNVGITEPRGLIGAVVETDLNFWIPIFLSALAFGDTLIIVVSNALDASSLNLLSKSLKEGVVSVVVANTDGHLKDLVERQNIDALWYFGKESWKSTYCNFRSRKETWTTNVCDFSDSYIVSRVSKIKKLNILYGTIFSN